MVLLHLAARCTHMPAHVILQLFTEIRQGFHGMCQACNENTLVSWSQALSRAAGSDKPYACAIMLKLCMQCQLRLQTGSVTYSSVTKAQHVCREAEDSGVQRDIAERKSAKVSAASDKLTQLSARASPTGCTVS